MKQSIVLIGIGIGIGAVVGFLIFLQGTSVMYAHVTTVEDITKIFPHSVTDISQRTATSINQARTALNEIVSLSKNSRTFANTPKALDELSSLSNLTIIAHALSILEMVSPDEAIRTACHEQILAIDDFFIDAIGNNVALYTACQEYVEGNAKKEQLTEKDWYYLHELMDGFKRAGLSLPEAQREQIKKIKKELAALTLKFDANIAADQKTIAVTAVELDGVPADFITSLKKDEQGNYLLTSDSPTVTKVMENCTVEKTRERMYVMYNNRAYPANDDLLTQIIAKRNELALALGYESYAAYELDDEMAKTPARARSFLDDLIAKVGKKVDEEINNLTAHLPAGVQLQNGKIKPWDMAYVKNIYKKNALSIDEQKIAEYFPMAKTVDGLLDIYQQFFSLRFEKKQITGLWHEEVSLLEVYDAQKNTLLGYFLMDLFPRPFKYTHACHSTIIPATFDAQAHPNVALSIVIANFPRSTGGDKPALLQRRDVETFFHEFGHALHALLGRTKMASMAGTHVKTDFVEMPSQMLEEWLFQKEILAMVSSHYSTGESLPHELIDRIIGLKKFDAGLFVQTQAYYARISLDLYGPGSDKQVKSITRQLYTTIRPRIAYDERDNMYASFGHLSGYGAKYYGYLWSKVFALDLFDRIRHEGLLNPVVGQRYVDLVIGQGGSVDPNQLLEDFLDRKPNQEAFLKDLGLQHNS